MEKKKCYVLGCRTVCDKLYRIPSLEERAEKWRKFCHNPVLDKYPLKKLHNSFQICMKHFAMDAFTYPSSGRLLRSAVPTLLPPAVSPSKLVADIDVSSSCTPQMSIASDACVSTPPEPEEGAQNEERRKIWIQKIKRENWIPNNNSRLCEAHFTSDQFELNRADGNRKLKPNAIPTIFSHRPMKVGRKPPAERSTIDGITISKRRKQQDSNASCEEFPTPMRGFTVEEIVSTVPQSTTTKYIRKHIADPCHMVEELPEVYTFVTLPHLEQSHLNVQWVYKILSGEEGQERIIYESPSKDDKDGFLLIKDPRWDGINLDDLHLLAIAYRPGILSLRDLRQHHLSLLKNIYVMGKEVIMEKYDIVGSQLRIFIQYQPSFYHLHVHFTTMNDGICESRFGKAHLLDSVINNIQICPTYYEISPLTFCLKESDDLFEKFEEHGLVKRIQQSN